MYSKKIENSNKAIEILRNYTGQNPYLLALKRDVITYSKVERLNDFVVEYVLNSWNITPKLINRVFPIADWYGEKKKEEWGLEETPKVVKIKHYLGETSTHYHCYIKYRREMEPVMEFLPKKGLLGNPSIEDFHGHVVDFDRYDRITSLKNPDRKLKPHQKEAIQFLLSRKKCILADDMGLGKSCSLAVAAIEGNFDSIIIICPASIKTKWKEELLWYVPERDITIIEGFLKKNKTELEEYLGYPIGKSKKTVSELKDEARERGKWVDNRFIIVNYDILDEFYTIPEGRSKEKIDMAMASSPMLQYIYGKKSLIIIDEAHRLSNTKSIQYGIVRDLIKKGTPDSIYLSTGTPITNNPKNFFNVLQLIGDSITDDWNYYMQRYCGAKKIPYNDAEKAKRSQITKNYCSAHCKANWYDLTDEEKQELNSVVEKNCKMKTIDGEPSNLEELKLRTSHVYLRRLKEDIEGVVPKYYHEYFYDLNDAEKAEYDRLWDEYETAQLEADPEKEINKELLEGGLYRQYLSKLMVYHTCELVDKCLRRGEKVVIATCYNEELFMLRNYYGDRCVIYKGGMDAKEKDVAQNKFTNDPNVNVFIGNIDAAGVGIDLVASRILVFNNISWVYGSNAQMEDRVHRITQKRDVHIFYQFFHNTQYEKMWNTVLKKKTVTNTVIVSEKDK